MQFEMFGSFQDRSMVITTGDQLASAWQEIARFGTVEALKRIAAATGAPDDDVVTGALRIQQSLELHNASKNTSSLTKPLLLYYTFLNLVRGILSVQRGGFGSPTHGAKFTSAVTLLECRAILGKSGTMRRLFEVLNGKLSVEATDVSLADCLLQIPELKRNFDCIPNTKSSIAYVHVRAPINGGAIALRYYIDNCTDDEFAANWAALLPWHKDECVLHNTSAFTLQTQQTYTDYSSVVNYCSRRLMTNLHISESPMWFDHIQRDRQVMPHRIEPYLMALYILSNVVRYEPHLLQAAYSGPSDTGLIIDNALRCADRYVPQLLVSLMFGKTTFFD